MTWTNKPEGLIQSAMIVAILTLTLAGLPSLVVAQEPEEGFDHPAWGFSLRAGGSFFSSDLDDSKFGPTINGQVLYNMGGPRNKMGHNWNMGVNFDYEHHELRGTKADFTTASVLPFVEFGTRYNHFRPYTSFGVGMNFSSVRNEPSGVDVDAKNSLALKIGIGNDFFFGDHIALNVEAAWKLNKPSISSNVSTNGFAPGASGSDNASVVQVLTGLRFFF